MANTNTLVNRTANLSADATSSGEYTKVIFQQGRPLTDHDLNEQGNLLLQFNRTLAQVLLGDCCALDENAFKIENIVDGQQYNQINFKINPGKMYVNGILCSNDSTDYQYKSPDNRIVRDFTPKWNVNDGNAPTIKNNLCLIVYIEVWEISVESKFKILANHPSLRTVTSWRIQIDDNLIPYAMTNTPTEVNIKAAFKAARDQVSTRIPGRAKFQVQPMANLQENYTYRMEIHDVTDNKAILKISRTSSSESFDTEKSDITADRQTMKLLFSRDMCQKPSFPITGQQVELVNKFDNFAKGILGTVGKIERTSQGYLVYVNVSSMLPARDEQAQHIDQYKTLKKWDQFEIGPTNDPKAEAIYDDEYINFKLIADQNEPGKHRSGNYWLIPIGFEGFGVESITANGPIVERMPIGLISFNSDSGKNVWITQSIRPWINTESLRHFVR